MHAFLTSNIGDLKNTGSLTYTDLPNVDTFIINTENSHLLILPSISSERPLKIGKLVSSGWQIQVFQNSNLCLKAQILSLATNTVICFPWSDRRTLFIFEKMLPNTPHWITIVRQSFFRIEWSCMKKAISLVHNSTEFTSAFPGDNHRALICSKHTVCRFPF